MDNITNKPIFRRSNELYIASLYQLSFNKKTRLNRLKISHTDIPKNEW
jgi:hypothetical protein